MQTLLQKETLKSFAHEHDDMPAFHAAFLVLTFISAAMFNIGAFGVIIIIHMCLDIIKYRDVHHMTWRQVVKGVFHESLVDITLLMVALVFSLYFHHSVGLVTISGLLHAEFTILRMLGTVIPKAMILEGFLKIMAHLQHYLDHTHPHMRLTQWTFIDKLYIGFSLFSFFLLLASPQIMGVDSEVIRLVIMSELVPWNL